VEFQIHSQQDKCLLKDRIMKIKVKPRPLLLHSRLKVNHKVKLQLKASNLHHQVQVTKMYLKFSLKAQDRVRIIKMIK
jgi:hypothetical protein